MTPAQAETPVTLFHLDGERGFRGGERQLLYLAASLRARGYDNVVCCRRDGALQHEALRQGFETLVLPFLSELDPASAWRLARAARRRGRCIVHAHTGHAVGLAALARLLGGPQVVAHRRVDFPLRSRASLLKYRGVARIVAVSRFVATLLEAGGLRPERIVVVPDALPVSPEEWGWTGQEIPGFAPANEERRRSARQALFAASGLDPAMSWVGNLAALVPHKDHHTLVEAAGRVLFERPGTRFLIAGVGPEKDNLLAAIDRLGLQGKVVLLGHRDAAELLSSLDVFVLSSWGEGMGSTLLEAMACGVPVVATAAGGIPEVIDDGRTGLLASPRDPGGLARSIMSLLQAPELARRLAAAALESLPRFGLAQAARRMEEQYRLITAPPPR